MPVSQGGWEQKWVVPDWSNRDNSGGGGTAASTHTFYPGESDTEYHGNDDADWDGLGLNGMDLEGYTEEDWM